MAKIRQQNVSAAQWSPNGAALGALDLTQPDNQVYGENVFSLAEQRQRLPKTVFKQLQATLENGEALDSSLADAVALAMKEWALEKGATHYAHWFQPLTGSTAEKHDSFYNPVGDGTAIAEFSGKELIQGEPDASSFPTGGIRATFEARGYTAWDPTSPAFILENPNGALLCIPTAFTSWTGEALDHKIPLLRSMEALSSAAVRALKLLGDDVAAARLHDGRARAGVLPDRRAVLLRAPRPGHDRAARCSAPSRRRATSSTTTTSARSPSAILACMLETERELQKLGVPVKTRHNEVAPAQYEIAPMFENSNVGSDHQQLDDAGAAERRAALRPRLPAAREAVRRRQRVGQAQQLVDGHRRRRRTCSSRARRRTTTCSSCSSARPSSRPSTSTRGCCARRSPGRARTTASARTRRRRRSSRSSSARSWPTSTTRSSRAPPASRSPAGSSASAPRCCRRCRCTAATATAPSPFAFTGNKFEFRAVGSTQSVALPNTVLNTIVAEAIDDLAGQLQDALNGGASLEDALRPVLQKSWAAHKRIVFDGDGYSEAWHKEAEEERGLLNLRTTPDALPYFVRARDDRGLREVRGAQRARARGPLRGLHRAVRGEAQHRGGDGRRDRAHAAAAGGAAPPRAGGARPASTASWPRPRALVDEFVTAIRALEDGQPPGEPGGRAAGRVGRSSCATT